MQTELAPFIKQTPQGKEADTILRACVHCGFCTATCPTYQLLGDELDGPRGRIYLIKQVLEGHTATVETQLHLDRCLTCRACETTCPSGVRYARLLEIGKQVVNEQVKRPLWQNIQRWGLLKTVPYPKRFKPILRLASIVKPLMPKKLGDKIPAINQASLVWPTTQHPRHVLILAGCVQSISAPDINLKTAQLLDKLGIQSHLIQGCCGALSHHLDAQQQTLETAKQNIDRWWPLLQQAPEAIILTASGCVSTLLDYAHLLENDEVYADKANTISLLTQDISQFIGKESLDTLEIKPEKNKKIAFHSPCSLQHGLQEAGSVERILMKLGYSLTDIADGHLCCGSAGSYSLLEPTLSGQLLDNKVRALEEGQPELIATANIGCLMQIQTGTNIPVKHWIELLV